MLDRGDVGVLLIAQGASLTAGLCPRCGRLSASGPRCRLDGAGLAPVDALTHAVELAADQAADVVVSHERASLHERGSIAALPKPAQRAHAFPVTPHASRLVAVG
jgi:hypothetical protein